MKRWAIACGLCAAVFCGVWGQETDSTNTKDTRWLAVPVVFRLPETGWGFGAAGLHTRFLGDPEQTPPSQVNLGFAYTQENQLLLYLPFTLYGAQDKWRVLGEVGYYRYSFFYFGYGNERDIPDGETFHVAFPRLRMDAMLPWKQRLYGGLRIWYEDYDLQEDRFLEAGEFASGNVPGGNGGRTLGVGPIVIRDRRDHVIQPKAGYYCELSWQHFSPVVLGDFGFDRYRLDLRGYKTWNEHHTLAARIWMEHGKGSIPFNQMAVMGGSRRMRGFYEGRFRDKNTTITQFEYRVRIWRRLGGTLFCSGGMVAPELKELSLANGHGTYGAGLRFLFDKKSKINIRLDVGMGEGALQTYFTFGEAF